MPRTLQSKLLNKKLKKVQEQKKELIINDGPAPLSSSCNGTTDRTFASIEHRLAPPLYRAIQKMGLVHMTEIQSRVFDLLLTGSHTLPSIKAIAKTGSGKTLAYLIPLVQLLQDLKVDASSGTVAIVVCPTRELAMQTYAVLIDLMQFCKQRPALVRGGGVKKDEAKLLYWGCSIVVGTPGRLVDHLCSTEGFVYNAFLSLVIDEADRLFEMGFEKEMQKLLKKLENTGDGHQTLMFSATDDAKVQQLGALAFYSSDDATPVQVIDLRLAQEQATVDQLKQSYTFCPSERRFFLLYCMLENLRHQKVMVFVNSRHSIALYETLLSALHLQLYAIHGQMSQEERNVIFNRFNREGRGVLMCTDIASRGWDIPVVDVIIQYDPPDDPREYIHRVGRTARGGREGQAIVMLRPEEFEFVNFMRAHRVQLTNIDVQFDKLETNFAEQYGQIRDLVDCNGYVKSLAKTAFTTYVRSYLSHSLKYIYNKKNLDLKKVAESFLLRKPVFEHAHEAMEHSIPGKQNKKTYGKQAYKKPYDKR
ncbi:Helicase C-terminal [Trinorchestia longiramus]|nr:Helicase C-terminal [Trinorchestia longiramus]